MIKYSETFFSPQGEGYYCGMPTVWLRFYLCNLQCDGFGQCDPTDPSTYILPYKTIDAKSIKRLEDMPVFTHGCDSSYSWSAKFKHLQKQSGADELLDIFMDYLPNKKWENFHLALTGGEPLLKAAQKGIIELFDAMVRRGDIPKFVTIETNGTQPLLPEFIKLVNDLRDETEFFFSVSPKLWTVAGEKDAIMPEVVKQYQKVSKAGQLKYVFNGTQACWAELDAAHEQMKEAGVRYQVMLMPVGATKEQQESLGDLVIQANKRGYRVTPRAHAHWFHNTIGT